MESREESKKATIKPEQCPCFVVKKGGQEVVYSKLKKKKNLRKFVEENQKLARKIGKAYLQRM